MPIDIIEFLHTEAPERKVYDSPPLVLVLCQIRFTRKLKISDDAAVAPFQDAIELLYPKVDRVNQHSAQIQLSGAGPIGVQSASSSPLWQFTDQNGDWTVSLSQESVSLETRSYAHFEEFVDRLRSVAQALILTIRPTFGTRIGLRYIDEIRVAGNDWSTAINPKLLGILSEPSFRENCSQSFSFLNLEAGDAKINIQYGQFPNGTTVVPKPGTDTEEGPFYLLDIDMSQEFVSPSLLAMNEAPIIDFVEKFHSTISSLFRWLTTDEYRATLGERADAK